MIRLAIIWFGTYAVYHTDLQSDDIFRSVIFPVSNVFYLAFLFFNFVVFLRELSLSGTKGNEVNIVDLSYDVLSLLKEKIASHYSGKFAFLGGLSGFAEDLAIPIEVGFVIASFYQELQLLAYLAN